MQLSLPENCCCDEEWTVPVDCVRRLDAHALASAVDLVHCCTVEAEVLVGSVRSDVARPSASPKFLTPLAGWKQSEDSVLQQEALKRDAVSRLFEMAPRLFPALAVVACSQEPWQVEVAAVCQQPLELMMTLQSGTTMMGMTLLLLMTESSHYG